MLDFKMSNQWAVSRQALAWGCAVVISGCVAESETIPQDSELDVESTTQELINGWSTDPSGWGTPLLKMFRNHGDIVTYEAMCSSTLLTNYAVLTAKHCLDAGDWAAAELGGSAARELRAYTRANDVAVVFLDTPLPMNGKNHGWTRDVYSGDQDDLDGQLVWCPGWGFGYPGGGHGEFRVGLLRATSAGNMQFYRDESPYDQMMGPGDSGGSCVHPTTGEIIHVNSQCDNAWDPTKCWGAGPDWMRDFVEEALEDADAWAWTESFSWWYAPRWTTVSAGALQGGTPLWHHTNGKLVQFSNAHDTASGYPGTLIIRNQSGRGNGTISVQIESPDNDGAGLVFRYVDENNYYRVSADAQRRFIRLVRKKDGVYTTLANRFLGFGWGAPHKLEVVMQGDTFSVVWDGIWKLTARDTTFQFGKVGLYSWANAGVLFDDLTVR
jgi:hypothetical protein